MAECFFPIHDAVTFPYSPQGTQFFLLLGEVLPFSILAQKYLQTKHETDHAQFRVLRENAIGQKTPLHLSMSTLPMIKKLRRALIRNCVGFPATLPAPLHFAGAVEERGFSPCVKGAKDLWALAPFLRKLPFMKIS